MNTSVQGYSPTVDQTAGKMNSIWSRVEQIRMTYFRTDFSAQRASDEELTQTFLGELNSLSSQLRDHFHVSENGACIEAADCETQHMAATAAELELLRQDVGNCLDHISLRLEAAGLSQAIRRDIESEFDAFCELLYDYEQATDQLVRIDAEGYPLSLQMT